MAQPDFKLSQVSVVMLGTRDIARAVAFYRDILGLPLQQQFRGFAFFSGGGVTLALSEPLAQATGLLAGATEVVFSVEDVKEAYEALRGRGVKFINEPHVATGPQWVATFEDPDGHKVSVFGPEGGK